MSKKPPPEPEVKGPDEAEIRQTAVVASTFANVELHSTKQTLQQYVQLYTAARDENQRLSTELQERDKDAMSVVHFLRTELEKKQELMKEQQKKAADDLEVLRDEFNEERKGYLAQLDEKGKESDRQTRMIEDLNADLDALEAFKRERNEMHLELARFRDQQKADTERYEAEISQLRFQSLEEKVRLKAEERSLAERFEKEVNARAMKLLDSKTKDIHSENYMLVQDKVLLEKELERQSKMNADIDERFKTQKREAELGTTNEQEYARRNAMLSRSNKQLTEKTAELENTVNQLVTKYEAKLSDTTAKLNRQLTTMTNDRDDANRNAANRHKELVRMRQLTKQIVQQRSDLETFFNEALDFVRNEIAREKREALRSYAKPALALHPPPKKGSNSGTQRRSGPTTVNDFFQGDFEALPTTEDAPTGAVAPASAGPSRDLATRGSVATRNSSSASSLPPIASAAGGSRGPRQPPSSSGTGTGPTSGVDGDKVDIANLSWVDKERVLRILFSKINQVRQDRNVSKQMATGAGRGGVRGALASSNSNSLMGSVPTAAIEGPTGDDTFMTTDPIQ